MSLRWVFVVSAICALFALAFFSIMTACSHSGSDDDDEEGHHYWNGWDKFWDDDTGDDSSDDTADDDSAGDDTATP